MAEAAKYRRVLPIDSSGACMGRLNQVRLDDRPTFRDDHRLHGSPVGILARYTDRTRRQHGIFWNSSWTHRNPGSNWYRLLRHITAGLR